MASAKVLSPQSSNCRAPVPKTWRAQRAGGGFLRAQRVLEPPAGDAAVPAAPVVGVPGVIDTRDKVRLPFRIGPVAAQDRAGRVEDRFIVRHVPLSA